MKNKMLPKSAKCKRREPDKSVLPRVLILTEGIETEPNYFRRLLRKYRLTTIDVFPCGADPKKIVETAIEKIEDYDELWCVFDRDDFPKNRFNSALKMCQDKEKLNSAYSNEAFELWYVLHFDYRCTAMSRKEYKAKLTKLLKQTYKKNDEEMFDKLESKMLTALTNAKRLMKDYPKSSPYEDNPSTTVYRLVERLQELEKLAG